VTGSLPTFGPTGPPVSDHDVNAMAVVRLAVALSRTHLRTALAASYPEMAEGRSLADLDVSEIRREVEGYLGANALLELDRETDAATARALTPDRAQWLATLDEAVTRAYAVPATAVPPARAPRYGEGTVTLATQDYGEVTLPEPAWCSGHTHHDPTTLRADIIHAGAALDCTYLGRALFTAELVQSPFATSSAPELGGRIPGVSVWPLGKTLDPVQLYGLAAALDGYADRLRDLADQLTTVLSGGAR
jgi:hypothetical protein